MFLLVFSGFFFTNLWYERHMSTAKVFLFNSELELPESFDVRHSFDISNCATQFDDAYLFEKSINFPNKIYQKSWKFNDFEVSNVEIQGKIFS